MVSRFRGLIGAFVVATSMLLISTQPEVKAQNKVAAKVVESKGGDDKSFVDAVTVPTNRESKRLIQAAQDYIKKKEWRIAAECLQSLLEGKEDSFIEIDGKDETGKATKRRVSIRTEANRLIGELPPDGLETYQVMYGQGAADALRNALDANDPTMLAEVALRYLHTKAGADATNLLGTYHLDRGSYLMAALSFERLLSRPDADKLSTKVLFKAALAFRRAGDQSNADKVWKKMADKAGRGELVFGGKKVSVDQLRVEFERAAVQLNQAGLSDWLVFRGNAARNAQGVGGTAYLEPRWTYSMTPLDESVPEISPEQVTATNKIRELLNIAFEGLKDKPILPAFFPVAANGKLIFRTYDGVHAVSLRDAVTSDGPIKGGAQIWASGADGGLHAMVSKPDRRATAIDQWYNQYYRNQSMGPPGVFFENSMTGTLSHDGQLAYFVDDLAIPPHPAIMMQTNFGNAVSLSPFTDAVHCNVLRALELETGKIKWSLGGRTKGPAKEKDENAKTLISGPEFKDAFFLGPPLPLAGKLYVLVEKNTELRVVCLDPNKLVTYEDDDKKQVRCPELVWQQSLGTANSRLPQDSLRRMQAAHLAYADGVLVCPTNAGLILGVDLLSHSLVWAHSYRDGSQPQQNSEEMQAMMIRGRFGRGGVVTGSGSPTQERWRPSPPIIQNGKVVFTAFDGGEAHCLNLRDGSLLWRVKREDDDLYLGGVFGNRVVIVGKSQVRALNLDDGKELWKLPTGMPSGQGAASKDIYYLPLQYSLDDQEKRPGVLAINLATGKPIGPPARSRKREPLGNLLFVDGELVSQTALGVTAFPELKRMLAEIDRRLKENPTDPIGLAERGELYLDKGDLPQAIEDLRTALANKPPADVKSKASGKLHEALTDLMQNNFPSAEKYLDEYKQLCEVHVAPDADANTKQKAADEQLRREANYLSLLGRGRERQGRLFDAFAAYEQFGALTNNKELVSVIDEPNTKSRPDVWSRGRIKAMIDRATPEQKKQLDEAIVQKWMAIRNGGDLDAIRKFVAVFGTNFAVGRQAQLLLAERLIASGSSDDLTEAETKLQGLCFSPDIRKQDPTTAGQAVEAMIRIYLKRGLYEDSVAFYKQLGEEFGNVQIRDGKTGADFLNELFTDKRFLPYLEPHGVQWKGAFRTQETNASFPFTQTSLTIEPEGDNLLPYYRRNRLVLDVHMGGNPVWTLRVLDRATNEERARFGNLPPAQYFFNSQQTPRFAFAKGHILVLHLNHMVFAFNLAERKEIWRYDLYGKSAYLFNNNGRNNVGIDHNDGRVFVLHQDGRQEKIGGVAMVESSYVLLMTREGLVAVDPSQPGPGVLWTKSNVSLRAQFFGDDQYIYIVEPASDGTPASVKALRAQDGVSVPVADFGKLYARRVRTIGRCILLSDEQPQGGSALRLYDVQTGQDVWKHKLTSGAVVVRSEDRDYTATIEKDRTLTILVAKTGEVLFKSHLQPEHANVSDGATLLSDRDRFYLTLNPKPSNGLNWNPCVSFGLRSVRLNGTMYALNRTSGKLEWVCDFLPHQTLLLEQIQDLPILLFASQYYKSANGFDRTAVRVTGVDKQSGKLMYDKEFPTNTSFHALRTDPQAGVIELVRHDLKITFRSDPSLAVKAPANEDRAAGASRESR